MSSKSVKKPVQKIKKNVPQAVVHIKSNFNNTIVTITDVRGNTLAWGSPGANGFKGSKRGTPFAAQLAARQACLKAVEMGVKVIDVVLVRGPGQGGETAIREVGAHFKVTKIANVTEIVHNGCRPPKKRRI